MLGLGSVNDEADFLACQVGELLAGCSSKLQKFVQLAHVIGIAGVEADGDGLGILHGFDFLILRQREIHDYDKQTVRTEREPDCCCYSFKRHIA